MLANKHIQLSFSPSQSCSMPSQGKSAPLCSFQFFTNFTNIPSTMVEKHCEIHSRRQKLTKEKTLVPLKIKFTSHLWLTTGKKTVSPETRSLTLGHFDYIGCVRPASTSFLCHKYTTKICLQQANNWPSRSVEFTEHTFLLFLKPLVVWLCTSKLVNLRNTS